jgi:ribosomal protein S24E
LDFKIKSDSYNALLARRELRIEVPHESSGTPNRFELRKSVASKLGVKIDNVFVISLRSRTGTRLSTAHIQVYDDPSMASLVLPRYLRERNLPPEQRTKKETRVEEKKAKPETKAERAAKK